MAKPEQHEIGEHGKHGKHGKKDEKREYFAPKIVHTEKLAARATMCAKSDSNTCGAGPIQS